MPRAQGFARGDFDTSFPIDDKFLALRQSVDPVRFYAASGVYWHVVAAAWREVERKPASRICPDGGPQIADLMSVRLLDSDERLPNRAFTAYVGRARRQRMKTSDRQRQHREGMSRVSHGVSRVTSRDAAVVTVSHNPARVQGEDGSGNTTETGDARDPADIYWQLTGKFPSPKTLPWIDDMAAKFGTEAVIRVLATAHIEDAAASTLLGRVQDRLRSESRELDRAEQKAEQDRLAEKRLKPRVLEPWQEEFRRLVQKQYDGAA